jgi:hypothetical protein
MAAGRLLLRHPYRQNRAELKSNLHEIAAKPGPLGMAGSQFEVFRKKVAVTKPPENQLKAS